uniref:Uncharacterized protein n=1 Tax=Anguilla anguilla TaxID=7936 RepID=A0A0E9T9G6_ANGAN
MDITRCRVSSLVVIKTRY